MANFEVNKTTDKKDPGASKLCMDVIGELWSQKNHQKASEFANAVREELNDFTDTKEALNDRYMSQVKKRDIQRHGTEAGNKAFLDFEKVNECK